MAQSTSNLTRPPGHVLRELLNTPATMAVIRTRKNTTMQNLESITLGGGCFWCIEAALQQVEGVERAVSGYAGGTKETADYRTVCSGTSGHAEVVQFQYDPQRISTEELLEVFFTAHDPTTLNRQGNDVGPQYRSVIFYHTDEQKAIAEKVMEETATEMYDDPVVTELAPLEAFYPAEGEHQDYYAKMGNRNPYCTFVVAPKVNKVRKKYAGRLKPA